MTQLTIANQTYPIAYPVAALTRLMRNMKINADQIPALLNDKDTAAIIDITVRVTWAGLVSGAFIENRPAPYETPEHLLESLQTIEEINQMAPALQMFTEAWAKFTGADEAKEQPADTAETEAPNAGELLPPTV
jgi:hypothetical protein